jgi:hypothetical protein
MPEHNDVYVVPCFPIYQPSFASHTFGQLKTIAPMNRLRPVASRRIDRPRWLGRTMALTIVYVVFWGALVAILVTVGVHLFEEGGAGMPRGLAWPQSVRKDQMQR